MISIIIPAFNEEKGIENTLRRLREDLPRDEFEIIVSDGGSTDRTVEIANQFADAVVTKDPHVERTTTSMGRNRGAAVARGELFAFIDADIVVPRPATFFARAKGMFDARPRLVGLVPFVQILPEKARGIDTLMYMLVNAVIRFMNNVAHFATGSGECQIVRARAFRSIGGYREHYIVSEDHDMLLRLQRYGRIMSIPALTVFHDGRRMHAIGWPRLLALWFYNWFTIIILQRTSRATAPWIPIR